MANLNIKLGIDAVNIRQGGGLTHLSQLLNAADPQKYGIKSVIVWASSKTANVLPKFSWLEIISLPWMDKPLLIRLFFQLLFFRHYLTRNNCDILLSPGGTLPFFISTPAVTISQNLLPFEPHEAAKFGLFSFMRLKLYLLRRSQSSSFKKSCGLIFLSAYAVSVIRNSVRNIQAKTAVIPHGIEPRFFQPPRPARHLSQCSMASPLRLLYVSILMPYKHQMEVANAIHFLREQGFPIRVEFVGSSTPTYGRKVEKHLRLLDPHSEYLIFSGEKAFELLHNTYTTCDLFIFASSCENLPNILIEAMASGLPIACSNRGPMPEILRNAGLYFNPEDSNEISLVVQKLIADEELRRKLSSEAFFLARQYSWSRCADETFTFITNSYEDVKGRY